MSRVAQASRPLVALSTASVFPDRVPDAFEVASRLGYDGVEVMVSTDAVSQDIDVLRKLVDYHGVPVLSVHAPCLLVTQRVWGREPWGKLIRAKDMAEKLGARAVVVHPPFRWQRDYARDFGPGLARMRDETDVVFAVENMYPLRAGGAEVAPYAPHWNPAELDCPNITLDLSHTAVSGVDAFSMAEELGDRLAHVHMADGTGLANRDEHLVPGRGAQPCAPVLNKLAADHYSGLVVLEVNTRRSPSRDARRADLAEALEFTRRNLDPVAAAAAEPYQHGAITPNTSALPISAGRDRRGRRGRAPHFPPRPQTRGNQAPSGRDALAKGMLSIMMNNTLITVAPTGAESDKSAVPALPVTLGELVATAKECQAAGASVIHVHIRDEAARPTLDVARLTDTVAALRESTDLIVQASTGGAVTDSFEARLAALDSRPDACSLTCGTVNFGDEVFHNPWPFVKDLYAKTQEVGVVPEFELFDFGHIATLGRLLAELGLPHGGHVHCDLVMGVPGGMPGDAATLVQAVAALPAAATWSATGIGRATLPVMLVALAAGGHLRVGMEDTTSFARGRPVAGNAELVERASTLAGIAQRPAMTPGQARAMLGVTSHR